MDESGKVDGAYRELQSRKHPEPDEPAPQYPHSTLLENWLHSISGPPWWTCSGRPAT
jgi:hypothetical protein